MNYRVFVRIRGVMGSVVAGLCCLLSEVGSRRSEIRSLRSEVRSRKSGGLKSEVGVNFVVKIKFHAEFLANYYLFPEIQSIPHYDFHNSLLTGIANLIIAEVPAL